MTWGFTAVAAATVGSSLITSKAAKDAANTQSRSADAATQMQADIFNTQNEQYAPYRGAGYQGFNVLRGMLPGSYTQYDEEGKPIEGTKTGTGFLTSQFGPEDLKTYLDPSMDFRMRYGQEGTNRLANVSGGAIGGNTLRALTDYSQNLASTEFGNAFNRKQTDVGNIYNRLASIAGIGQSAQNTTAQLATGFGQNAANLAVGSANAQAAGTVGSANALSSGVQGAGNAYMMSQLLRPTATPGATTAPTALNSLNYQYPSYSISPA